MGEWQGRDGAWESNIRAAVSGHDLTVKRPPQSHISNASFSAGGAILEGSRNQGEGLCQRKSSMGVGSLRGCLIPDPSCPFVYFLSAMKKLFFTHSHLHDVFLRQL